jgi:hypothetical protein
VRHIFDSKSEIYRSISGSNVFNHIDSNLFQLTFPVPDSPLMNTTSFVETSSAILLEDLLDTFRARVCFGESADIAIFSWVALRLMNTFSWVALRLMNSFSWVALCLKSITSLEMALGATIKLLTKLDPLAGTELCASFCFGEAADTVPSLADDCLLTKLFTNLSKHLLNASISFLRPIRPNEEKRNLFIVNFSTLMFGTDSA